MIDTTGYVEKVITGNAHSVPENLFDKVRGNLVLRSESLLLMELLKEMQQETELLELWGCPNNREILHYQV